MLRCDSLLAGLFSLGRFGDIKTLTIDAIVNSTNESMNDPNGLSGQILEAAGPELFNEISKMEPCRTGESRITGAYKLPCQYASMEID